jgi:hypothetical protein
MAFRVEWEIGRHFRRCTPQCRRKLVNDFQFNNVNNAYVIIVEKTSSSRPHVARRHRSRLTLRTQRRLPPQRPQQRQMQTMSPASGMTTMKMTPKATQTENPT